MIKAISIATGITLSLAAPTYADTFINENLSVAGLACIGACVEDDFGLNLLRLKSTAPGLQFEDTSMAGSPTNDWLIAKNTDSLNIIDESGDFFTFSEVGRFGIGAFNPVLDLHVRSGDTPAIRLDQDTTGGDPAQIWDIGGNESNFFIRDPGSSTLPFRIRPGAPENALYVAANGEVGMGIPDPQGALHIRRNQPNNVPHLVLQNRRANGRVEIWMQDDTTPADDDTLRLQLSGDIFNISFNGTGGAEFQVSKSGDVRVQRGNLVVSNGGVIVGGATLNVPDYVFADDYEIMPLFETAAFISEHRHLPYIPSRAEVAENGLDLTQMQLSLLKTVEELTLHTLDQQRLIEAQRLELEVLKTTVAKLAGR